MKFVFVLWALVIAGSLSATPLPAKANLSGRIVDANYEMPLEFATVAAYDNQQILVTGISTDSTGKFLLRLPKGQYNLKIEFIRIEFRL